MSTEMTCENDGEDEIAKDSELKPLTRDELLEWRRFMGERQADGERIIYVNPRQVKRLILYAIELEKTIDGTIGKD